MLLVISVIAFEISFNNFQLFLHHIFSSVLKSYSYLYNRFLNKYFLFGDCKCVMGCRLKKYPSDWVSFPQIALMTQYHISNIISSGWNTGGPFGIACCLEEDIGHVHQIRVKWIEIMVEMFTNTDKANRMQMCLKATVGGLTVGPVSAC